MHRPVRADASSGACRRIVRCVPTHRPVRADASSGACRRIVRCVPTPAPDPLTRPQQPTRLRGLVVAAYHRPKNRQERVLLGRE